MITKTVSPIIKKYNQMAQAINNKTGSFNSALFGSFTLYKAVLNLTPVSLTADGRKHQVSLSLSD